MFAPLYPLFEKNTKIYEIVGFDVETYSSRNIFYLGGLQTNKEFIYFYKRNDMIKHIMESKEYNNKIIVATNLGFDFSALFFNTPYWSKFKIIYSGSKLLSAIYHDEEKEIKITFYDTSNYMPLSVFQMGEILNLPKLNKPKCLGKIPKNNKEKQELLIYNKRDCEISKQFLELLQTTVISLGGKLKMTIASCGMDVYRRRYHRFILKHETEILKDEKYYEFVYDAYFGGRTEIFSRGTIKNAKVYDINSLYPFVMLLLFPFPPSIREILNPNDNINFSLKFKGLSKVNITTPKYMKYPYLPKKHKVGGSKKLLFPLGTWTGTYTHFELNRAIELGYKINKVYKTYIYKKSFYPYKEYVKDLYNLRMIYKKQNSNMELGIKLLLNSLYGKFGQRNVTDTIFIDIDEMNEKEYDSFIKTKSRKISMNSNKKGIETIESECSSSFVFPIFPVYVTAYARDVLYNYIVENDATYCDTDSITTFNRLKESKELGGMKEEYNVVMGIYIKPKMYMVETGEKTVVKIKGVPIRSRENFFKILRGETLFYDKFTKIKESIRRDILPNTIIETPKFMKLEDTKRVWKGDFNFNVLEESDPIVINEWFNSIKTKHL